MRWSPVWVALSLWLGVPISASASLRSWSAPSDCPTEEIAREQLAALLPSAEPDERWTARVLLVRDARRWWARIEVDVGGQTAHRELAATSCDEVATAALLVIAMAVEALEPAAPAISEAPGRPPQAPARPPPPAAAPPETARARQDTRGLSPGESRRRGPTSSAAHGVAWNAGTALESAVVPGVGLGVTSGATFELRGVGLEIRLTVQPGTEQTVASSPASGRFAAWIGVVGVCGSFFARGPEGSRAGRVEIAGCARFQAGIVEGEGEGVRVSRHATEIWLAPEVGLVGRVGVFGPFALRLDAGAYTPLRRPRFVLDDVGTIHRADALGMRLALAGELHFR